METTWIVVGNASEACIYAKRNPSKELEFVLELKHPESHEKGINLVSDRPGHYQSKGAGHGALVESSNPKENEAKRFARQLAEKLEKGRRVNKYQRLLLLAPPQFHGLLNKQLSKQALDLVTNHVNKDYTKCTKKELISHLSKLIII